MTDQVNGLLSPFLRDRRINAVLPHIKGKVLDYGCGTGTLCKYINNASYVGIDIDEESIALARRTHPAHFFYTPNNFKEYIKFDTIVGLAVIEHIKDPGNFLLELKKYLNEDGRIILTTPHPCSGQIHYYGSRVGLFSKNAEDEHEALIDMPKTASIADENGLKLCLYTRFLFGVNQLIILEQKAYA